MRVNIDLNRIMPLVLRWFPFAAMAAALVYLVCNRPTSALLAAAVAWLLNRVYQWK